VTAFKIDENLPIEASHMLRQAGLEVATVLEQCLGGHPDGEIALVCQSERRALITLDVDFANIDACPPADYPGLVVLRLGRQDKGHVMSVLGALVPHLVGADPSGRLGWSKRRESASGLEQEDGEAQLSKLRAARAANDVADDLAGENDARCDADELAGDDATVNSGCASRICSIRYGVQPPWAGRSTGSTEALPQGTGPAKRARSRVARARRRSI
jgi:predicted nuclease of predicted toxin-antitoxin system